MASDPVPTGDPDPAETSGASPRRARGSGRRGRPRAGVREKLLDATEALLNEVGVTGLSTREIAHRAGVAESGIFYHFGDRLGLLYALIQARLPQYWDVADEAARTAGHGTLRDNLLRVVDALEAFYLQIMPITAAIQADQALRGTYARRSSDWDAGPHRALEPVVRYLVREIDAGRIRRDLDTRSVALLLIGTAHYRAMQRYTLTDGHLPEASAAVDTLLPTLVAPS
jgi:AcrR family transcriptional regulator